MKINLLDLFSGIGGFSLGLKQAGFEINKHFYSEVDKHAIAIYKHKFEDAEYVGSVTDVRGSSLPKINAITFGSPCQDFSLAGKGAGMGGERSSLITHAIRLIAECRPDFFIWKNVKGTFSSNAGEDFWAIIKTFADIGGYRLEWQLLNTAWFLPQNRERIYLVGRLADKCAGQVFPIEENFIRTNEGAKQATTVRTLTAGGHSGGMHSSMSLIKEATNLQGNNIANTIRSGGRCSKTKKHNWDIVKVGTWRTHKDGQGLREVSDGNSPTIPARAGEDGSGQPVVKIRNYPRGNNKGGDHDRCPSIEASRPEQKNHVVSYAMGSGKPSRSCIGASRVPEVGDKEGSIRRLTEIECERLQGFPDNWTKLGNYEGEVKEVSATQRYKCLGNAVTVDVVQAVGERVLICP